MGGVQRALVVVGLATGLCGCAAFRLNGCTKLAICGDLAAYTCGDDLVCANHEGETLSSELVTTSRKPCHICAGL
jgi:hypothetical protein